MQLKLYFKNPKMIVDRLTYKRYDDEKFLKYMFKRSFGYDLNLDNPRTFNEKLQWLKLYDRKDIYTKMVDKYEVKNYVADKIGKEYIIKTLGIYEKFEDIEFNKLPNKFVIKCTHDSGGIVICKDKDKLDLKKSKKIINKSLKNNFYLNGREWPYKNVKPRIIIEKYMEDEQLKELRDYKFFCFNGKCRCFKIDYDRYTCHKANYYDECGNILEFGELAFAPDYKKRIELPKKLKTMVMLAEKLADNNKFLRVDLYEINGKIYFGELTFYPASGFGKFTSEEWDLKLGDWINLK